jgi:hypothetical protein
MACQVALWSSRNPKAEDKFDLRAQWLQALFSVEDAPYLTNYTVQKADSATY